MSAEKFLRHNKTSIQKIMMSDRPLILNKCVENELVTHYEYINLQSINKGTEGDHVIGLVDKIMGKGDKTCQEFLHLLQTDEDIKQTFPQFKEVLMKYTSTLPKPVQESTSTVNPAAVAQDNRPQPREDYNGAYPLKSKPKGLCFIINNVDFKDGKPRLGSDFDAQSLAEVFSWLEFRVLMCKDQTKDQMDQVLKCLSSATDISNLSNFDVKEWSGGKFSHLQEVPAHGDAFICCILSHGNTGVVCGVDKKSLAINDIKKTFKASAQSPLTAKPKVFLIQACQGGETQGRVALPDIESDAFIPDESDILLSIATVEGCESYRDQTYGSWYIQSVCNQLRGDCPSGVDMFDILHRVNNEVSRQEGRMRERPGVILKQMPEIRSTLRKKLVL